MQQETITIIRKLLTDALTPTSLEIIDESADHIGHPGAAAGGGHYRIIISAAIFEGKKRVQQHRLINAALADLFKHEIHALAIEIRA